MPWMNEVEDSIGEDDATVLTFAPPTRVGACDDLSARIEGRRRLYGQSFFSTEGRR
jgi:hypothetical protein